MPRKKLIFFILIFCLLLQGCWLSNMPVYVPPSVPTPPILDDPPLIIEQTPTAAPSARGMFIIRYEPANTLNPILALNRDNISITSLMYESLFVLDENLTAAPLLCESWESEDNITFIFTIFPDIAMHNGDTLTASDVAYSIRQARQRGRHRNKLRSVASVNVVDDLTLTITLDAPNARFIRLLDTPIIKADTMDDPIPPGTGPFTFPNPDSLRLARFSGHRNYLNMPLPTVYLRVASDSDITELFDQGGLSLLWDDPTSAIDIRINRDHEPRYYNTTSLHFLGFNSSSMPLWNPDVRRAIGCAIERQYIVENIMNVPRPNQTVAANVAISPVFDMYDANWEPRTDPLSEMAALLDRAGVDDYDQDGLLELYDGWLGTKFTLNFIVNIENTHKVAAAEHIADSLRQVGFNIDLRLMPWDDFMRALRDGKFDLYYGEVQLGADFDFSPLLIPDTIVAGDSLNYGGTANNSYRSYVQNFLAAETWDEVNIAGKELCDEIRMNAPFIPILYKRHAIYSPIGVISGAKPSESGVFNNFQDWTIDLHSLT
ncbi:MAG: ABC transporter substrate-binding protein [Oscillospiraceae bacterium]|nr:ABC transporter substrate-binding protein [Oscillospiraceae bacterium]